jgi:hypothetical protein
MEKLHNQECYYDERTKEDELLGGTCSARGKEKMCIENVGRKTRRNQTGMGGCEVAQDRQ